MNYKICIYGGTFDILHDGHKAIIHKLVENYDLVYLVPTSISYYKQNKVMYTFNERLSNLENWLRTTFSEKEIEKIIVSDIENNKDNNWRFIDTLKAISKRYPKNKLYVAMGGDSFINIKQWEKYEEIVANSNIVVVNRPGYDRENYPQDIPYDFIDMNIDISSTQLRTEIRGMTDEEFEDLLDSDLLDESRWNRN